MDRSVLWRSALVQTVAVTVLAIGFALALPHSFFEDWGWLAGPLTWLACAALTARVLRLPLDRVMLAAIVAGIVSVAGVLIGVHWLGVALAIAVFAFLCAHAAARAHGGGNAPGESAA
jgi:hypothetical protein